MKRKVFFVILFLGCMISTSLIAQKQVRIEDIFDNPGKFENEQVTITGIVNQYFQATTQTTSYYIVQGDYGGLMNVNTSDAPPVIARKYEITGVVVIDQVLRRPLLIEKSRSMVGNESSIIIYILLGAVLLLLVFLALYIFRGRKTTEIPLAYKQDYGSNQSASSDSSAEQDYATIKISTGPPPTMILIPGELEIISGLDKGKSFRIAGYPTADGSVISLGRDSVEGDRKYAHIQLMEKTVSRKQAELIFRNSILSVKNLSETNFTQVDGIALKLNESTELKPGMTVRTGEVEFKYKK
jgi:hypothetical protein